jgi:hypothetical protein
MEERGWIVVRSYKEFAQAAHTLTYGITDGHRMGGMSRIGRSPFLDNNFGAIYRGLVRIAADRRG